MTLHLKDPLDRGACCYCYACKKYLFGKRPLPVSLLGDSVECNQCGSIYQIGEDGFPVLYQACSGTCRIDTARGGYAYVLMGESGEYTHHDSWQVAIYYELQMAFQHLDYVVKRGLEIEALEEYEDRASEVNIYDPFRKEA